MRGLITMNDLYPVYIVLFSNDTDFGKLIRKTTGSEYSHATISLDPSLNNMYSFSDIPYSHARFVGAGFVRESIYSPMYRKNRFFTVLITFVNKEERDNIQSKIDYFCENYTTMKYNDIGLIQYYLNFKETKGHNEEKKKYWFCSEFVSYMCKSGNVKGFNDILLAPQDIKNINNPNVINVGNFTIPTFKDSELVRKTEYARKEFIRNRENHIAEESFYFDYVDILQEVSIKNIIKMKKKEFKETDIHPYTALIDWKNLYDEFVKLFPDTDPNVRFDLYELIVRKVLVPFKRLAKNATHEIYMEVKNIYKLIGNTVLKSVDMVNSLIYTEKNGKSTAYKYPVMTVVSEMYDDVDTLKAFISQTPNYIRTDMIETFFE